MPPSKLDAIYRSLLLTKFFTKGWGKPENLQRYVNFDGETDLSLLFESKQTISYTSLRNKQLQGRFWRKLMFFERVLIVADHNMITIFP